MVREGGWRLHLHTRSTFKKVTEDTETLTELQQWEETLNVQRSTLMFPFSVKKKPPGFRL